MEPLTLRVHAFIFISFKIYSLRKAMPITTIIIQAIYTFNPIRNTITNIFLGRPVIIIYLFCIIRNFQAIIYLLAIACLQIRVNSSLKYSHSLSQPTSALLSQMTEAVEQHFRFPAVSSYRCHKKYNHQETPAILPLHGSTWRGNPLDGCILTKKGKQNYGLLSLMACPTTILHMCFHIRSSVGWLEEGPFCFAHLSMLA